MAKKKEPVYLVTILFKSGAEKQYKCSEFKISTNHDNSLRSISWKASSDEPEELLYTSLSEIAHIHSKVL